MSEAPPDIPTPKPQPQPDMSPRLRSVPYRRPFIWAQIFAFINYCAAVALLTVLPLFFLYPNPVSVRAVVACVIVFMISGVVSFLKRRHVICPLCKGAPLVNSRARVHSRATRIFPLDYGTSAMILLIFTQMFRCMYCGAKFDVLKPRHDPRKEAAQDNLS